MTLKTRDRTELHQRQRIKLPLSSQCTHPLGKEAAAVQARRKRGDQFGTDVDNSTGCAYHFVSSQGGCVMRALRFVILLLGLVSSLALTPVFAAEKFPSHPIKFVVGFSAGGPTDTVARIMCEWLTP